MRLLPLAEENDAFKEMKEAFLHEQAMQQDPDKRAHARFFIEHMGKNIGFSEVQLEEECFPDEDLPEMCLKIYAFYIAPSYRGQHLGREAFKLLRQWGRDNEAALVETEVNKTLEFSNDFMKEQGLELAGSGPRNVWRGFI